MKHHHILDHYDPEGAGPVVEEIVVLAAIILINVALVYLLLF